MKMIVWFKCDGTECYHAKIRSIAVPFLGIPIEWSVVDSIEIMKGDKVRPIEILLSYAQCIHAFLYIHMIRTCLVLSVMN